MKHFFLSALRELFTWDAFWTACFIASMGVASILLHGGV